MEQGPVSARIVGLWERPRIRLALGASLAAGIASTAIPLARVPGFESALAANVLVSVLGGVIGVAAARQERDLAQGDGPVGIEASPSALTATLRATFATFVLTAATIVPFAAAAAVAGLLGPSCSITAGLPWYPALPLPSAFLAAALGVACGASFEARRLPGLLYGAILLASLAVSAWPLATGPQSFFYNHLAGFVPGPLYDELVRLEAPLVAYRRLTVAWGAAVVFAVALLWRRGRLGLPRARPAAILLLLASLALVLAGTVSRHEAGWEQTDASVEEALGGRFEGERCTVVHPRELDRDSLRRFAGECDHRVDQLETFFGINAIRPKVFLYRNRAEKRRLVGAASTQFAKPWLGQIHVDDRGFPHPILKHELAHLIAGPLGRAPFHVPAAAFGLLPLQGLIEGAAVAADWPAGELSIHEEARGLRELGLAPRLDRILSATGFWSESASRAYTYAGSFVRWLVETRGAQPFGRLYRDGDFAAAYGAPLPALIQEWEAYLDSLELPARASALMERRFRRPAIFRRPCAREVAALSSEAGAALASGDGARAAEIYAKCANLDPGDPAFLQAQATAYVKAGEPARIAALLEALERHSARGDALRAGLRTSLADAWAKEGRFDEAATWYQEAAALEVDEGALRSLAVKLEAVGDPALAAVVLPFLDKGSDAKLFAIRDKLESHPDFATGWYLLGRRLYQRGEYAGALAALDHAPADSLLPSLVFEADRIRALSLMALDRDAEACALLDRLSHSGEPHQRPVAADLLGLCRHDERRALRGIGR